MHGQAPILWTAAALLRPGAGPVDFASSLALDGIAHVAFRVSNLAASRAFYEKLGFEQAFEFGDAAGPTTSYLKINDRQFIELYRRNSDSESLGLMHVCFDTSDIERLRAAYLQQGLQPPAAAKARAGNLLFSMRDPEAQLLEYTQYLPGSLHWKARGKPADDRRISEHLMASSVAVKDLAAEAAFYVEKLGFGDRGGGRLQIAGTSGEQVMLEPATERKPRIEFAVPNIPRAVEELRRRGLTVQMSGVAAMVVDPDGVAAVFH